MAIAGIDAITYSTDRWDQARRFFADWGLALLADAPGRMDWETLTGAQVRVRAPDDPALPAPIETGPTLREVTWGVSTPADLDALAARLAGASHVEDLRDAEGVVKARDPHGLGLVFRVSAKRDAGVKGAAANPWGSPARIDAASPVYERATPVDIGHVVLFTDRIAQAEAFYTALGFVCSDRYPGRGVFLRCAAEGAHHNLFLLQLPGKPAGLNHVAFAVRDIHEVFGGGLHMSRCGWKTQLGPGRHPISSAYFWYFENPCGGLIEYNADEDHLTAAWQPRDFEPGPTVFAEWAIEGGLDGHTRRQPRADNAGTFLTERRP